MWKYVLKVSKISADSCLLEAHAKWTYFFTKKNTLLIRNFESSWRMNRTSHDKTKSRSVFSVKNSIRTLTFRDIFWKIDFSQFSGLSTLLELGSQKRKQFFKEIRLSASRCCLLVAKERRHNLSKANLTENDPEYLLRIFKVAFSEIAGFLLSFRKCKG